MARQTFKQRPTKRTQHDTTESDAHTDRILAQAHDSAARARRIKREAETFLRNTA